MSCYVTRLRVAWVLWLLCAGFCSSCEEDTVDPVRFGRVEGQVLDARTNQPLANTAITTNPATSSFVTDAQGKFSIAQAPEGRVAITAKRADYRQETANVTITEGQTAMVTVLLERSNAATTPPTPIRPNPADKATNQPTDLRLTWSRGPLPSRTDTVRYDVVLYESNSTDRRQLLTNAKDTTVQVSGLKFNTTYYWQVTARTASGGTARADIWSFQTRPMPDNRFLLVREENGNTDIYSSDEAGTNLRRLTTSPFIETAPQLNPNRDRIAYTSNATGLFQLYTMNRDGTDARQISVLPVDGYFNQGIGFRWSPDGAHLIYSSYNKLYRINRDGTGLITLATAPADRHFRECDWTAQGNRIVVQTIGINPYDAELYLLNADGSGMTQLVGNLPGRLDSPSFSIDGRRVVYTRDVDGFNDVGGRQLNAHIFTQNLDGTGLVDVSAGPSTTGVGGKPLGFNDVAPRYSPDGAKIIFVQVNNVPGSTPDIYTAELNGSARTRLFQNGTRPDWR
ncbi:carboxypeptidase-like regulatory domain-containing protein [Hymenobacter weizhouensis]|uniref:carboxypeptidase-like regulatory domain-containing protein n=1 Tax=Hymenobacter sp. YIM 151500-1 TaxID=2987689 RepID=UPI0022271F1B|nr:carboxypeptidase regulatory-like domain-containing protein [Hymenobacter sp. YIM 151500-1]UYZ63651.1 carboxypeptidase-like regulatory domain-containing protein [Hymenobacter sp. YIM 151500-1]